MIKIRTIPCWGTRSRHLLLVAFISPSDSTLSYGYSIGLPIPLFRDLSYTKLIDSCRQQNMFFLSPMIINLIFTQRMQLPKFTCEYKFPMEFELYIVYIFQIFSCWQHGLSINPILTWLHWKAYYT